jgi:hypothetical protein
VVKNYIAIAAFSRIMNAAIAGQCVRARGLDLDCDAIARCNLQIKQTG